MTLREQYADALQRVGYSRITSRSGKYWTFSNGDPHHFIFLGKAGAFRSGPSASNSLSVSTPNIQRILKGAI